MAINAYLKLETPNIEGDCTAGNHEKEIEILNWNHGFVQPSSWADEYKRILALFEKNLR